VNWLAHAFLSKPGIECRMGNLLADHVRGRDRLATSPEFQRGMRQHQTIDAFTDSHQVVHRSRARIGGGYRHLTGILVDVFYDHFLALDWLAYSAEPLEAFTSRLYSEIRAHPISLPAEARYALDQMLANDRLGSSRTLEGIEAALKRVSLRLEERTGKQLHLEAAIPELTANFSELNRDFAEFFPALRAHVDRCNGE
jgi:acyl carrier protein phosphodiesterase